MNVSQTRQIADAARPADGRSTISWAGWSLPVRDTWRPMKIEGSQDKGTMVIGDAEKPLLLVQWRHPGAIETFDADAWLRDRFRRIKARPSPDAPKPAGIERAEWVRELETREGQHKTIWYGYANNAGLLIELTATSLTEQAIREEVFGTLLPRLEVSGAGDPCRWELYNVSFQSPPRYVLLRRHLYSGDIALLLRHPSAATLMVRQVYPAALALSRRPLGEWLDRSPFMERRRFAKGAGTEDAPPQSGGAPRVTRRGWKRLPSPLGWLRPRFSTALAAVDATLDRLLIAEHQSTAEPEEEIAAWAVGSMNLDLAVQPPL